MRVALDANALIDTEFELQSLTGVRGIYNPARRAMV
jgi:hypothetical protein